MERTTMSVSIQEYQGTAIVSVHDGWKTNSFAVGIVEMVEFINCLDELEVESLESLYQKIAWLDLCKDALLKMRRFREHAVLENMCIYEEISYC
jgi:hypothetical protein